MKTCYQIEFKDEVEFDDDDDDALVLALQPFDTIMSVGYGDLLTHKPVKFVARRSDIIVSSTLSITLTPADSDYRPLDKGLLMPSQLIQWCHKRHQFRGIQVELADLDYDKIRAKEEEALKQPREQINSSPFKSAKTMKA